jgi:tetratricopeptide (TPR) repeat protein
LGEIALDEGDRATATASFEECVSLFESIEDNRGLTHVLDNLGGILSADGDYDRAEALYARSLRLGEELGDNHAIAETLRSLGSVAHWRGDHARASAHYEDSAARFAELNDARCRAKSLIGLALTAYETGEDGRARAAGDEGLELLRGADVKGDLASSLALLGRAALTRGDLARSAVLLDRALSLHGELRDELAMVTSLEGLASILVARGRSAGALAALGAADAHRRARASSSLPAPVSPWITFGLEAATPDRAPCERAVQAARAALGDEAADRAWSSGADTKLDEAVARARQELAFG